jgi:hypothetical protein
VFRDLSFCDDSSSHSSAVSGSVAGGVRFPTSERSQTHSMSFSVHRRQGFCSVHRRWFEEQERHACVTRAELACVFGDRESCFPPLGELWIVICLLRRSLV